MDEQLSPSFEPAQTERRIYAFWEEGGYFHTEPDWPGTAYTIVIPPPNVTAELHMGHALNNTLQDLFIRWRRMQGFNTLWVPGTDHAGIATQNVVERELAKEGLRRQDLGRERFLERVWQWKEQYGSRIIDQLKRLGCSCDWARTRFTMDEGLSRAVVETFVRLYEKGLIYRGKYIVNWCPRCQTALSDLEVEHEEHQGHLWHIRYPFAGGAGGHITVATTRPETMLGDTAVAVHPADERYASVVGRTVELPIIGRVIPVIADEWVDRRFGTGAVKVTPAHDPNDFDLAGRHGLPHVVVIDEEGRMTRQAGPYEGMDRFECREALVEDLRERQLLEKVEAYQHSVGHCYRCHSVVEPYLSDQWYVRVKPLAQKAAQAARDGRVQFHPERWKDFYLRWLEEARDWCISRQIWWGHRLPAYFCMKCQEPAVARQKPDRCPACGHTQLRQAEDVLDTWFSSALWPFSTLGWPDQTPELARYYPTDTLVTDRGIIYFWVARMVMMGMEFMGREPFRHVYIHGTILDELGRKMSKSLGNGIDPVVMIDRFGADAVRFCLVTLSTEGQDLKLSESKFEMGRHFANKIWNAARFSLMNLGTEAACPCGELEMKFEDRWILSRLQATVESVTAALEGFHPHDAAQTLYDFFWHELCDWYVELVKPRLRPQADAASRRAACETLVQALDASLRLLHPLMPYITEELWQQLKRAAARAGLRAAGAMQSEALVRAPWPVANSQLRDAACEEQMAALQAIARAVRNLRKEKGLPEGKRGTVTVSCPDSKTEALIAAQLHLLKDAACLSEVYHGVRLPKPPHCATAVVGNMQVFLHLEGLVDIEKERQRLQKQQASLQRRLDALEATLRNADFLANAPAEVVQQTMQKAQELRTQMEKVAESIQGLG